MITLCVTASSRGAHSGDERMVLEEFATIPSDADIGFPLGGRIVTLTREDSVTMRAAGWYGLT